MIENRLLTEEEITDELKFLPLWEKVENTIIREIVAANFVAAVGIVNSMAIISELIDHHPDILIYGWNKIRISSKTHTQGGLTEKDFLLAKKIEELNF